MIVCYACKKEKPLSEFPKSKRRKSGHSGTCKPCNTKGAYDWQEKNKERYGYRIAKHNSKKRGHAFNLEFEDYLNIVKDPCHYCGSMLWNKSGHYGAQVDRIDNSKGYEIGNLLPCCWECNHGRSDAYTVEEWKVMIKAVMAFRKRKNRR